MRPLPQLDMGVMHRRRRSNLAQRRNRLFVWLPLYNFLVLTAVLTYQSPWELLAHRTKISAWVS